MHVAVLDIGKTNIKLALVDIQAGQECAVLTQPNPKAADSVPYPHADIDAMEAFLLDGLKQFATEVSVDAITVTTHGACVVLVDDAGEPVLPVLDYEHSGPEELAEDYAAVRPSFAETGSPRLPGGLNIGAQVYWQQKRFPEAFARATALLTWPQFWVCRLCGVMRNDLSSLGCHSDLYRPREGVVSSLAQTAGWTHLMPEQCKSGELMGALSPALAEWCGLPTNTPVHAGIHDSNASLVPYLVLRQAPFAVVSTGTWFVTMAVGSAIPELDPDRDTLINVDAFGRPVPSARFMGGREWELLTEVGTGEPDQPRVNEALDSDAYLMPSEVSGTGPFPAATSGWIGEVDGLETGVRETLIAFYLAMMTAECVSLIAAEGPTIIEGPLSANKAFLQMLVAATGRPVEVSTSRTGTSIGAAMLVAASSASLSGADWAKDWAAPQEITVDEVTHARLQQYAERWRDVLVQHLNPCERPASVDE